MATTARQITSYLKGLAILLVIVTHYSKAYAKEFHNFLLRDYADFAVSIFFILSGYGIYYSLRRLEEYYGGKPLSLRLIGTFFWQRALRIYPLFWLSLFSASFLLGDGWYDLHSFSFRTVATYMAFPTVRHDGYTWFIPALIQCYLAAPFLYYLLRKLRAGRFMAFLLALEAAFILVTFYYWRILDIINSLGVPDPYSLIYRTIFLSNVLLFASGLVMPLLVGYAKPFVNKYVTLAAFIAFLLSMYFVRDEFFKVALNSSQLILFPLFLLSVSCFCLSAIAGDRVLPFSRPVAYLGGYSFTLYLFHWQYYLILEKIGLLNSSEWLSAIVTIVLFPFFLMVCMALQWAANRLRVWLDRPSDVTPPGMAAATSENS